MTESDVRQAAIARLLAVWDKYPDLRLGQLIGNVHRFGQREGYTDPYYLTDDEFLSALEPVDVGICGAPAAVMAGGPGPDLSYLPYVAESQQCRAELANPEVSHHRGTCICRRPSWHSDDLHRCAVCGSQWRTAQPHAGPPDRP
jgi:hypothetical protein